jgi:glucoamylase
VRIAAAALVCVAVVAVGAVLVSGGSDSDPRTPAALPGLPPPFLGTAVTGDGGMTAAVDAYGDVVDLRTPGPAGRALIDNPSARQAAGTVPADTGIVPRVRVGGSGGEALPMWRAGYVRQRYVLGTNVVRTVARFLDARVTVTTAASGESLAVVIRAEPDSHDSFGSAPPAADPDAARGRVVPAVSLNLEDGVRCARERRAAQLDLNCRLGRVVPPVPAAAAKGAVARANAKVIQAARVDGRDWLAKSRPLGGAVGRPRLAGAKPLGAAVGGVRSTGAKTLGSGRARPRSAGASRRGGGAGRSRSAPAWATAMYERSLLTIHALTSGRTGAVAAGARDGWAYVWPRDAATAALALEASGHSREARQVTKFLTGLDLDAAARFTESGAPVPGRAAQGDAKGWVTAAALATHLPPPTEPFPWRDRSDYQESSPGTYLGNALAAAAGDVDGPKSAPYRRFSAHQRGEAAGARRIAREFGTGDGLVRVAGDPGSGLDSSAGWAVRPFGLRTLYPAAERTLLRLVDTGTSYGITPGEGWQGGEDPWMAPTAWSAWALAALARTGVRDPRTNIHAVRERGGPSRRSPRDRHAALRLLGDLRRASTPAGDLPERVGAHTGIPTSTTPLLWSSAFAVLALRELWP